MTDLELRIAMQERLARLMRPEFSISEDDYHGIPGGSHSLVPLFRLGEAKFNADRMPIAAHCGGKFYGWDG